MRIKRTVKPLKILSFDIENRPLSYWYDGNCTAEITAIAGSFHGSDEVKDWVLGEDDVEVMLDGFCDLYDEADIVTGHYIRKHDLPIINGACLELGWLPLKPKLTVDTKLDLTRVGGLSVSQENLGMLLGLEEEKYQMNQTLWREANRLTPEGVSLTRKRVRSDVIQHKELYRELVPYLKKPKVWRP